MKDWPVLQQIFVDRLKLRRAPVAVAFLDREPADVEKFHGSEPSGCSFWRLAAEGKTFYTVPADHFNCAVGSYTHNIDLSPERAEEMEQTLDMMVNVGYLRMEEVPKIPQLPATPKAVLYSPLGQAPVEPSVALFSCRPSTAMLLNEAVHRAGGSSSSPTLGRPTCMALPAALEHGSMNSLGCIGNRTYTDIPEDELYIVIPATQLAPVADALETIVTANRHMADYGRSRREQLSSE